MLRVVLSSRLLTSLPSPCLPVLRIASSKRFPALRLAVLRILHYCTSLSPIASHYTIIRPHRRGHCHRSPNHTSVKRSPWLTLYRAHILPASPATDVASFTYASLQGYIPLYPVLFTTGNAHAFPSPNICHSILSVLHVCHRFSSFRVFQ